MESGFYKGQLVMVRHSETGQEREAIFERNGRGRTVNVRIDGALYLFALKNVRAA